MKIDTPNRTRYLAPMAVGTMLAAAAAFSGTAIAADPQVINLTQVGCQFLESENGKNLHYKPMKKADCEKINAKTGPDRLAKAKVLKLKPGKYVFRVTNKNVPYELGFYLREKGYNWRNPIDQATKTAISGGGLTLGKTKDYEVTLKPGEYEYSCPLNPTPDYKLVVAN